MWSLRERLRDGLIPDKPKTTPNVKEDGKGEIFSPIKSLEYLPVALGVNYGAVKRWKFKGKMGDALSPDRPGRERR
jgi:hypothetical protein